MLLSQPEHVFEYVFRSTVHRLRYCKQQYPVPVFQSLYGEQNRSDRSLDARLQTQAKQLQEQQEKLKILETALHCLEHQLRTPLAMIQLQADLLEHQNLPAQLNSNIHHIKATIDSLQVSLKRLTQCGLGGALQRQSCDLRSLVQGVVDELTPALAEKQISCCIGAESCWVMIDEWQIRQVFQNILNNAIAFSPTGSRIDCHWTSFQQEVVIQIGDQGPGLSLEDLQRIFKPFYSKRSGGTGLGLAIAHKIVLDHQGSLWAENLPTGGAQFSLVLPFLKSSGSQISSGEADSSYS